MPEPSEQAIIRTFAIILLVLLLCPEHAFSNMTDEAEGMTPEEAVDVIVKGILG